MGTAILLIEPLREISVKIVVKKLSRWTMFPFWGNACWGTEPPSHKTYQERKLKFLKWMRDDLETRLAGINAAIDTIERQLNREDTAV